MSSASALDSAIAIVSRPVRRNVLLGRGETGSHGGDTGDRAFGTCVPGVCRPDSLLGQGDPVASEQQLMRQLHAVAHQSHVLAVVAGGRRVQLLHNLDEADDGLRALDHVGGLLVGLVVGLLHCRRVDLVARQERLHGRLGAVDDRARQRHHGRRERHQAGPEGGNRSDHGDDGGGDAEHRARDTQDVQLLFLHLIERGLDVLRRLVEPRLHTRDGLSREPGLGLGVVTVLECRLPRGLRSLDLVVEELLPRLLVRHIQEHRFARIQEIEHENAEAGEGVAVGLGLGQDVEVAREGQGV